MPDEIVAQIIIGAEASKLERYAAEELQGYLRRLFGVDAKIDTQPVEQADAYFVIGTAGSNPLFDDVTRVPTLSDQGFLLRRVTFRATKALLMLGGSPSAALWAVYEAVERYGVRYLLHEDVFPSDPRDFSVPLIDRVWEPRMRVRCWRTVNDFAAGTECWGIDDYRPVLDQLAKMKFNRIRIATWAWQPYVHLDVRGAVRDSATLWFDYHYPITDDMPGRELFDDRAEFWHPDLPLGASYDEFRAAGETFCHALLEHAHARGMETAFEIKLTEYPRELEPIIPQAQTVHQLGNLTVGPGPDVAPDDPDLLDIAAEVARQTVNAYPEADLYAVGMPEFRAWAGLYQEAWDRLDAKYGIADLVSLQTVLERAQARTSYAGGVERAVQEAKGDLVALYFLDTLFVENQALSGSENAAARLIVVGVAEELFPIVARIFPDGWECNPYVDYTSSHILRRPEVLGRADTSDTPWFLCYTLHDDNIGVLPQLATGTLARLTEVLCDGGWSGFITRYWMPSDHDPCLAYLAKAAWAPTQPEDGYRTQIRAVCGDDAVESMLAAYAEIESVTGRLELEELGVAFPVPGMMEKHWQPKPMSDVLADVRDGYRRALDSVQGVPEPATEVGRRTIAYWDGRLRFGIGYLDVIDGVHRAATAYAAFESARDRPALDEAISETDRTFDETVRMLNTFASVVRNASDRGAIATMDEYVYRFLKGKLATLRDQRPASAA